MKVAYRVEGLEKVAAELERRFELTRTEKAALMDRYGMWMMETAAELSPFDTGFMASHVTYVPLQKGWFDFEVGWYRKDFDLAGHPPYYFFQEFGTIHHAAQPSLGPAWRELSPHLQRDAAALIRRTMVEGR